MPPTKARAGCPLVAVGGFEPGDALGVVAEHDAVVATGHVDLAEQYALVDAARGLGVKVVMTHALETLVGPDHPAIHPNEVAKRAKWSEYNMFMHLSPKLDRRVV